MLAQLVSAGLTDIFPEIILRLNAAATSQVHMRRSISPGLRPGDRASLRTSVRELGRSTVFTATTLGSGTITATVDTVSRTVPVSVTAKKRH